MTHQSSQQLRSISIKWLFLIGNKNFNKNLITNQKLGIGEFRQTQHENKSKTQWTTPHQRLKCSATFLATTTTTTTDRMTVLLFLFWQTEMEKSLWFFFCPINALNDISRVNYITFIYIGECLKLSRHVINTTKQLMFLNQYDVKNWLVLNWCARKFMTGDIAQKPVHKLYLNKRFTPIYRPTKTK